MPVAGLDCLAFAERTRQRRTGELCAVGGGLNRRRANRPLRIPPAYITQSRPDSGLGFKVNLSILGDIRLWVGDTSALSFLVYLPLAP